MRLCALAERALTDSGALGSRSLRNSRETRFPYTVRCEGCQRRARVVEVNDHGRLFYALDCPHCGLHIPHAPSRRLGTAARAGGRGLQSCAGEKGGLRDGPEPG
jgi:hypothetical protein